MKRCLKLALAASAALTLSACESGYNIPFEGEYNGVERDCSRELTNQDAIEAASYVYNLLLDLSCERAAEGVIIGQTAGSGNQVSTNGDAESYYQLFTLFDQEFSSTPSLLSIDYALDENYTSQDLKAANQKIIEHWNAGGVVMISWRPFNFWRSASGTDYSNDVDLASLIGNQNWRTRLRLIGRALKELQDAGVAVLWRPLPEMNTGGTDTAPGYWWGLQASADANNPEKGEAYVNLWMDMKNFFESDPELLLNNLVWVYSPAEGTDLPKEGAPNIGAPIDWAYPGPDEVDVIAPVVQDDDLFLADYDDLIAFNKPLGLAEFSPKSSAEGGKYYRCPTNEGGEAPEFYAQFLGDRLERSYPYIAFWASPYSIPADGMTICRSEFSLVEMEGIRELVNRDYILDLRRLGQRNWRQASPDDDE